MAPETIRRLGCDAGIVRVVIDGDSQPLDVGRKVRTVTPAIRKALELRDGGCTWTGCTALASSCDAHHIIHWADGIREPSESERGVGRCAPRRESTDGGAVHRLITIVAISMLALTACGGDQEQSIEDLEETIRADVFASTQVETRVRCHEDARVQPNATFECYVSQANGQTGIALVTVDEAGVATFEPLPNPP